MEGSALEAKLTGIDRREALRYLHLPGVKVPEEILVELERAEDELLRCARPRAVWRLFDREPDGRLAGTTFTPAGEDIRRHLDGCDQVILMATTLGLEVENLLRRAQTKDMAYAVILDAAASAAIERVCDMLCGELAAAVAPRVLTERYSPGYGDLPLLQQRELFDVLDVSRRIGVSLSESGLMVPQKSVTALLGVSDTLRDKRENACADCSLYESCSFRKVGTNCGR